jgi:hypothetical protein
MSLYEAIRCKGCGRIDTIELHQHTRIVPGAEGWECAEATHLDFVCTNSGCMHYRIGSVSPDEIFETVEIDDASVAATLSPALFDRLDAWMEWAIPQLGMASAIHNGRESYNTCAVMGSSYRSRLDRTSPEQLAKWMRVAVEIFEQMELTGFPGQAALFGPGRELLAKLAAAAAVA